MGKNRRVAGSYFVSTLSIALVLVVVGVLFFMLLNARIISNHVRENIGFSIIVKDNVNDAEIKKLQKILDTKPFVSSSEFISKAEAARNFKAELGEDFEQVLGYNPLRSSIEIKLNHRYANNDSLAKLEKNLADYEIIQEVSYQKNLVEFINENIRKISIILLIAGAALVLISFTLIRNTIHLAVYAQRFLIKTMQLVGAKAFFICKPFIRDSMWFGFFGSMFANLILLSGVYFLQKEIGSVINIMNREVVIVMVVFVFLSGILLSFFSSWLSVNKYLRRDLNSLYN
ncbi:permease-like cell division protein FtsX [Porphyromonadaceae bacterium OttesenSCG-928-L07]|nr:permease-like cell division protein FtsX [Porphyromonadaceae bacterium OttesenSCG-928-L07]MDL2331097.1 permease-like cell division protein FtsX [Odoribacter sp. OttesenSCG-928-A06]